MVGFSPVFQHFRLNAKARLLTNTRSRSDDQVWAKLYVDSIKCKIINVSKFLISSTKIQSTCRCTVCAWYQIRIFFLSGKKAHKNKLSFGIFPMYEHIETETHRFLYICIFLSRKRFIRRQFFLHKQPNWPEFFLLFL